MGGPLSFIISVGGILLIFGISGALAEIMCRFRPIKQHFDALFNSLPMGRKDIEKIYDK